MGPPVESVCVHVCEFTCMVGTGQPSASQVSSKVCPSVTVVGPVRAVISGGAGWRHKYSESEHR